ncbi:MAG: arsenate reductase ArsC [Candidatus Helarchaeota archaeon]
MSKKKILFLCTGNSCRSQMAEGLLRYVAGDRFEVYSAGSEPAEYINPLAVLVMNEIGIDITKQYPKHIKEFTSYKFDYVITLCESARNACLFFPGTAQKIHWNLEDPAKTIGSETERLIIFRKIRDLIYEKISEFLKNIP